MRNWWSFNGINENSIPLSAVLMGLKIPLKFHLKIPLKCHQTIKIPDNRIEFSFIPLQFHQFLIIFTYSGGFHFFPV